MAAAAVELRAFRRKVMADNNWSLRDLYRTLDVPGLNPLRDVQDELDAAVRAAYGLPRLTPSASEGIASSPRSRSGLVGGGDVLAFLLELNHRLAAAEKAGEKIVGPGLPPCVKESAAFITTDCVQPPTLS